MLPTSHSVLSSTLQPIQLICPAFNFSFCTACYSFFALSVKTLYQVFLSRLCLTVKDWMKDGAQKQAVTSDVELTLDTSSIITALQGLQFTELTGLLLVIPIANS